MSRYALGLIFLVVSFTVSAVHMDKTINRSGQYLVRIINDTPNYLACQIWNGNYYVDFSVAPNSSSRWYIEPINYYEWECQ